MKKKNRGKIISYLLLAAISILMLFPFFWMVRSSFMTNREIMTVPIQWLPSHYNLDNFRDAFALSLIHICAGDKWVGKLR